MNTLKILLSQDRHLCTLVKVTLWGWLTKYKIVCGAINFNSCLYATPPGIRVDALHSVHFECMPSVSIQILAKRDKRPKGALYQLVIILKLN